MSGSAPAASWGERLASRLLRFIPESVAISPERALINAACVLMGISALFEHHVSQSLLATWPHWLVVEWSVGVIMGGTLVLATYARSVRVEWARPIERVGILLIILCCGYYGLDLLFTLHMRGLPTALIFLAIAAAKTTRLIVSSATQGRLLARAAVDEEDRRCGGK